ncbi:MAG: flippase-like domain-containing protein [Fibrobacter sp.]|nr:flippase-like domain-containing protein [Fibrobacter sp.]
MKVSTIVQVAGGLIIASAGLYIFFKDVDIKEIGSHIQQTEWWVIALVALMSPISLWLRALRWRLMLPRRKNTHKHGLFSITVIAFAVNNILPARLGEAVRAVLLWRRNRFTIAESVGSLVLERAIDSTVFLSCLFLPIFFVGSLENLLPLGVFGGAGFAGILMTFLFYAIFPDFTKKMSSKVLFIIPGKFHDWFRKLGNELISNLDWIFSLRKSFVVAVLSYAIIFCYVVMIWLLGIKLSGFAVFQSMFGVAFAALGSAIPLAPGYVGTLHAVLQKGLALLGVQGSSAAAITVLYHAIGYVVVTFMGIVFFFTLKLSVDDIGKAKQQIGD